MTRKRRALALHSLAKVRLASMRGTARNAVNTLFRRRAAIHGPSVPITEPGPKSCAKSFSTSYGETRFSRFFARFLSRRLHGVPGISSLANKRVFKESTVLTPISNIFHTERSIVESFTKRKSRKVSVFEKNYPNCPASYIPGRVRNYPASKQARRHNIISMTPRERKIISGPEEGRPAAD